MILIPREVFLPLLGLGSAASERRFVFLCILPAYVNVLPSSIHCLLARLRFECNTEQMVGEIDADSRAVWVRSLRQGAGGYRPGA